MTKLGEQWRRILHIAIFVGFCHVPDAHAAALTFDSVVNGSNLNVSVFIDDVTDLFTFGFDFTYDGSVFDVTSVQEGTFLQSAVEPGNGTDFVTSPETVNADLTSVFTIAGSLTGATQSKGASTNDPALLALIILGVVPGNDPGIVLSNIVLLDSKLDDIPLTPVPEPATIGLLGLGLLGVARRVRRQRQRRPSDSTH